MRAAVRAASRSRARFLGLPARRAGSVIQPVADAPVCGESSAPNLSNCRFFAGRGRAQLKSGEIRPFCLRMGPLRLLKLTSAVLLVASACKQPAAPVTAEKELHPHKAKEGKGHADAKPSEDGEPKTDDAPQKYTVPFAWETSKAEPLALTRSFLK